MKRIILGALSLVLIGAGCQIPQNQEPTTTQPEPQNGQPTSTPDTQTPVTQPAQTGTIKIFLVALEDNGRSGKVIGCGDSIIPVNVTIPATTTPLMAAMKEMVRVKSQYYGQSGLYNALYQSNLQVASATIVNGKATIKLTGTYALGGTCDNPRFEAQLKETALQFPTVQSVEILINGTKIEDLLSGQG